MASSIVEHRAPQLDAGVGAPGETASGGAPPAPAPLALAPGPEASSGGAGHQQAAPPIDDCAPVYDRANGDRAAADLLRKVEAAAGVGVRLVASSSSTIGSGSSASAGGIDRRPSVAASSSWSDSVADADDAGGSGDYCGCGGYGGKVRRLSCI